MFFIETEALIHAPVSEVWAALTQPEITRQYFYNCEVISGWEQGGEISFVERGETEDIVHVYGTLLSITPEQEFSYTVLNPKWSEDEAKEKQTVVEMDLTEVAEGTKLSISQGPYEEDDVRYIHGKAGWGELLQALKALLEAKTA